MAEKPYPPRLEHELKNQLGIISGYCELLLGDTPPDDPRHADILEIQKAAAAALQLIQQHTRLQDDDR